MRQATFIHCRMGATLARQALSPNFARTAVFDFPWAQGEVPASSMFWSLRSSESEIPLTAAPYSVAVAVPAAAMLAAFLPPIAS